MKMIKNKKVFGLFNLFDFLIIGLVLLLLLSCYYRYFVSDKKELYTSNMEIEYVCYINKVDHRVIDNINIGEHIYMVTARENTYLDIGKITNIELVPYYDIDTNEVLFYDVILTVIEIGNKVDDDYVSHTNVELHVGNNMDVITLYTTLNINIKSIREL